MTDRRQKALVFFHSFTETIGGSEYLVFTVIKELLRKYDVTLALNDVFVPAQVAANSYGIHIDWKSVSVIDLSPRGWIAKLDRRLKFVRKARLRRLGRSFDVCVSCSNVVDFGRPGIHFVYMMTFDPWFQEWAQGWSLKGTRKVRHELVAIRDRLAFVLSRTRTPRQILNDCRETIFPNSEYVRAKINEYYGCQTTDVFYPPTLFETDLQNCANKLHIGYLGRICDEKRVKELIAVVLKARELSGLDLQFKIAGVILDDEYGKTIKAIARQYSWCELCGAVTGLDKAIFLSSISIALHGRSAEEFGIAITEYIKAGVIPIVPKEGGPREIVGSDKLCFSNYEEAVAILIRLVSDEDYYEQCRKLCSCRKFKFSAENYLKEQHAIFEKLNIV